MVEEVRWRVIDSEGVKSKPKLMLITSNNDNQKSKNKP